MNTFSKIGIFGGSFNPIHIGHLIIANFFVIEHNLDICFFVPNHISPFKTNENESIEDFHRLKMIELAIRNNPKFAIETFEIDKGGISYTFETILHFKTKYPLSELFLLIGYDQLKLFTQWKNWEIILENSFLVAARRNTNAFDKNLLPPKYQEKILYLENPIIEISSTQIRNYIKTSKSIDYLVPEEVKNYIKMNNLYRD